MFRDDSNDSGYDPFNILGINPYSCLDDIENAYFRLTMEQQEIIYNNSSSDEEKKRADIRVREIKNAYQGALFIKLYMEPTSDLSLIAEKVTELQTDYNNRIDDERLDDEDKEFAKYKLSELFSIHEKIIALISEEKRNLSNTEYESLIKNTEQSITDMSTTFYTKNENATTRDSEEHKKTNLKDFFKSFTAVLERHNYKDRIHQQMEEAEKKFQHIDDNVTDKAFLWKAEKKGCAPIYIFGSMHDYSLDKEDYFGDAVNNTIDKVAVVFREIGQGYKSEIQAEIDNESESHHKDNSIDTFVTQKAHDRGKLVRELEDSVIREAAYGTEEYAKLLKKMEEEKYTKEDLLNLTENYMTHVSPLTCELSDTKDPTARRNFVWMEKIVSVSEQENKPSLVVCGALHNSGKFGLPNLLANEGYTLTPLMKMAPTPRSTLIREMFTGEGAGFFNPQSKQQTEKEKPGSEDVKKPSKKK